MFVASIFLGFSTAMLILEGIFDNRLVKRCILRIGLYCNVETSESRSEIPGRF
jgi:hypothetical protein